MATREVMVTREVAASECLRDLVDYRVARIEATEGRSNFPTVPFVLYNIIALALQFHIHTKNVNSLRSVRSYQYLIVVRFFQVHIYSTPVPTGIQ